MGFWDDHKGSRWTANSIGDVLVGTVKKLHVEVSTKRGEEERIPVVTVEEHPSGAILELWAGAVDLKTQLADLEPDVGWKLRVEYTGTRQTGQPKPMKLFRVQVWPPKPVEAPEPVAEAPETAHTAADEPETALREAMAADPDEDPF